MTTSDRKSSANALRSAMQFARQQLCIASSVSKLSIAATVFCTSAGYLQAQEKEPPRLFRGGLVQQLRSLTDDSSQSRTDEAPQRKNTEGHLSDGAPVIPKPRPANEKSRASTPTESRSANLRANQQPSNQQPATRSAPQTKTPSQKSPVQPNTIANTKSRTSVDAYSNAAASINSKEAGAKPNRQAELGIPVTNSKLANEARFQLNDKPEANGEGYSAKSKYDAAKSKDGGASGDADSKVFNDAPKVQAVESMSQAPKVSRKPLPAGSQVTTKPTPKATEPKPEQPVEPKSQSSQVGLKPMGGSYSLEGTPAPKSADPAPKPTDYPSLQAPSFAAPGATNAKNLAPATPKLPQFPTPPAGLNSGLTLPTQTPNSTSTKAAEPNAAETKVTETKASERPSPALLLPNQSEMPIGLPSGLPSAETGGSGPSYPALLPNVPAPTTPSSSGIRTENNVEPLSNGPRATNPIRTNSGAQRSGAPSTDEHMAMETPRLQVVLKGPSDMPVGTPADYQVLVRNVDDIPLDGVILRLEIPNGVTINQGKPSHGELQLERTPDGATLFTWSFENLAAYQNASAPLQLTAKSARNFAVAMEWTLVPKNGETQIEVRQARLELALEGPSEAEYGVANMYRLHVRNPGTAVAKNVNVKLGAASFGASETQIPEILPGEQQSIDVELTFNEKGTISINAEADAAELHSAASINVLVKRAMVTAAITGSDRVYRGASSSYEVRVQNTGDLDSRAVRAELAIPEGAEVLSKPSNAAMVNNILTWDIPGIKAGEAVAFPVELNIWSAGEHKLALTTSTAHAQPSTTHITTLVEAIADLKLVVNDPIAPAPVGGTVTYEMSITNRGSRAATNVRAVAQFSDGIEPVQADGGQHRIVTGQVIFEPLARIEAGETKVLRVQAKAAAAGTHRFRAEVRSDESDLRLVQEETTQYLESASRIATPVNSGKVVR